MMNKTLAKELGKLCKKTAEKYEKFWRKTWAKEEDFEKLMKGIMNDAQDIRSVGTMVSEMNFKGAHKLACSLDTIIRDEIPSSVWDAIEKELAID